MKNGIRLGPLSLALPGASSSEKSGEGQGGGMEIGFGFLTIAIGNNINKINTGTRMKLVKFGNHAIDLSKVIAASFQPETSRQVAQIKLIFDGGGELILQGADAVTIWGKLDPESLETPKLPELFFNDQETQ